MKTIIERIRTAPLLAVLIALGLGLASTAWADAPTPTAVWQTGEFRLPKSGYSISLNGNDINADGNIVIKSSASAGVTIDVTDVLWNAGRDMSVLIKYSNATAPASRAVFVCVLNDNDGTYDTGLVSTANNAGTLTGYWNSTASSYGVNTPDPTSTGSGYFLYSYKHNTGNGVTKGVYAYNGSAISNMSGGSNSGLCWPNRRLHKIAIGGPSGSITTSYTVWPNLVIEEIAIFVGSVYTNTQMSDYKFPQLITVDSDTSVSAINAQLDSDHYDAIAVLAADGTTINVDAAFNKIISVSSEGSVTLSANSQPDASYLSGVDFSGVKGALLRSWLTPGVVGFNFNANGGRNAQGNTDGAANTALALEIGTWYKDAYSATSSSTAMFSDGLSLLSWRANNVYAESNGLTSGTFIQGYLDDGNNVIISLTGVPYETYDIIIYCSTDDSSKSFKAKTVNGTIYTWDSTAGETTTISSDTTTWGLASAAAGKAVCGANTLRINNLTGPLSIKGGTNGNGARGCISAIQIMPAGTSTAPEMTVGTAGQTTQATWTGATWNVASAPTSGNVIINVSGNVELTVDETVALSAITVTGEGSLKIIPDQQNSVTLTASSISSAVPLIFANDGIGIDTISASVTYLYKTTSITSSLYGNTYTAGVGAQGSSVSISHNGGSVTLQGATYYLGESHNATATTVTFDDATAVYSSDFGVGMATYSVEGSSSISAQRLILSQGANSRTAEMTVKDTASINVTGTSDVDSNQASIMFGHWNGPSTFTIQDSATFTAASQVLVGKTSNNHTINLNGGTFTATGIKASSSASGTNTLNLNGGLAVLGTSGITSYGTTSIAVNVGGDSEIRASAATLPISQPLTIASNAELSFTKADNISETAVSLTGAVSGSGNISVGPGVTLNLGTNRPAGEISVDEDGVLTVVMTNKGDVPVLKVSSEPSNVILYDTDGTTEISDATVVYDDTEGTITVMPPMPRWTTQSNSGSFDTAANWSTDSVPTSGDVVIELSQDTTISISETYTLSSLTITGTGTATLSGTGTITAGTVYVVNGATLTQDGHINATSISLDSGTVLKLNGVTESAVISGAGAVETYGTVVLAAANSMTGGITVKSGSSLSTSVEPVWENPTTKAICDTGFGPYNKNSAYSAQSRVVVEDGGCVDINNIANKDTGVALTISGKGILNGGVYSGAVKYSGSNEIGNNSRQISSLSLAADAMVDVGLGCGLVHSGHAAASLALNGYTLTMRGTGTVPMVNVTASSGTLVMDGATLKLSDAASNFTGVNVVAKGCATLNMSVAPTAIGSLTLKPTASGTTASAWNLPAGLVPAVDASNIDPSGLSYGANLTLFTAPNQTELTDANISVIAGSRYTTAISGNTVTATVKSGCPTNFMHYDFNAANSIASDSTYNIGNLNPDFVVTRNGKAGTFDSSAKPYYDGNTSSKSPFYAGEMTITTLLKPMEANNTILWNFGSAFGSGIALIAKDSSTLALVSWTGGAADGSDVVSVSEISGFLNNWHLVTVVANACGTTLYVDNKSASVSTVLPADISGQGQFGSIHGAVKNYTAVSGSGFLLDDWRVYDAALTASEIETIKVELVAVTITVPDVANTTVSVTVGGVEQVGVDGDGVKTYSVSYGSAVVVTYAAASGCRISGTTTYNIASATEDSTIAVDANLRSDLLVARINGIEIDYTLQEAVTASSAGDTIILFANCDETAVDTTGKDFIFNENGHAFGGTLTGSGRIVLSAVPTATSWSSAKFVADGVVTWTGTVVLNWADIVSAADLAAQVNKYGIAASIVEVGPNGSASGYLNSALTPKFKVDGSVEVKNGSSSTQRNMGTVCGSGTLVFTNHNGGYGEATNYKITNLNDWDGTLTVKSTKVTIENINSGSGEIKFNVTPQATPTFGSGWAGSFVMNWTPAYAATPSSTAWVLDDYGVSGSTVVVAQAIEHGYLKDKLSATAPSIAPAVYLKANLTVDNGFYNATTTFSQLGADEGVVFTTRSSGDGTPYAVTLLKDFAGSFNLLYGSRLTIDTIERSALPSAGDLVVAATAQTDTSTPASFNVASTKIRVAGVDTVVPLAYSTSVAVDESGLYKAVAQISTAYYATMQEAITAAGDSNLASITVLDGSAALPDGYYKNNGVVTKYPVALVTSGASDYKPDVQSAIIAAGMAGYVYDYIEILVGGDINVPLDLLESLKIKNTGGATLAFTGIADDCNYDEDDSNPAYTVYTKSNKPTTYTWVGGVEDTLYPGRYMWAAKGNWRYANSSSETVTASRQPQAGDSVVFNTAATVNIAANTTVEAITTSVAITFSKNTSDVNLSATTGIVLTDAAASITVTGVTLSPTPTTTVANSYVAHNSATGVFSVDTYKELTIVPNNSTVTVATNGVTVAGTSPYKLEAGTVTLTVAPNTGYSVSSVAASSGATVDDNGNGTYTFTLSEASDAITVTTVDQVSSVAFSYYASYTNASVTVGVTVDGAYTLNVGGNNYTATASSGSVTFANVDVSAAKFGESTAYVISYGGEQVAFGDSEVKGNAVDGSAWMREDSAGRVGSWTHNGEVASLTYSGTTAALVGTNIYTAAWTSTGEVVTVTTKVAFGSPADSALTVDADAQAAIRIGTENGANVFQVYAGPTPSWGSVYNDTLGAPTDAETYALTLTLNYANQTFGVSVGGAGALTNAAGAASFPLAKAASSMQKVSYLGAGTFTSLAGSYVSAGYSADVGTEGNATNVVVSSKFVETYLGNALATDVAELLNPAAQGSAPGVTPNGLNYFKCYALGLDPTKEEDKPIVDVTTDTEGKFVFTVKHRNAAGELVEITPADNVSTTVTLKYGTDANTQSWASAEGTSFAPNALPFDENTNVLYYKAEVTIGAK